MLLDKQQGQEPAKARYVQLVRRRLVKRGGAEQAPEKADYRQGEEYGDVCFHRSLRYLCRISSIFSIKASARLTLPSASCFIYPALA